MKLKKKYKNFLVLIRAEEDSFKHILIYLGLTLF